MPLAATIVKGWSQAFPLVWWCGSPEVESFRFFRMHWDHEPTPYPSREGNQRGAEARSLLSWEESRSVHGTAHDAVEHEHRPAPLRVRSSFPLPARSGERIKLRGASDCVLTA